MLSPAQLNEYRQRGHLTVPDVFSPDEMQRAIEDVVHWSEEYRRQLTGDQLRWYLEAQADGRAPLRKLDNPTFHREVFRGLATHERIVDIVEQLLGPGVSVFFSQVFMKPAVVGGPKPIHQDNFYFGPDQLDATLTVWVALDEATVENGCLYYGDGSHKHGVFEHFAPPDEPFNLQVPGEVVRRFEMTPAPVPSGGVSFHHGNTLHQSSSNTSPRARRAVTFHYLRNDATLTKPALDYDPHMAVSIATRSARHAGSHR